MGIVVTLFMLLALLLVSPIPVVNLKKCMHIKGLVPFIGFGLLCMGLWNALWFGIRHWHLFWGQAALVSGLCMVVLAVFIIDKHNLIKEGALSVLFKRISVLLQPVYIVFLLGLLVSFFLYFVTLVQLNLGYPIVS
ncbi:MAG: hypothetical protein ACRBBR_13390 [Cellvibrionaceae bacterium]